MAYIMLQAIWQVMLLGREGMLAQLVEQRTFNPFVVGSTPAHPTSI